MRGTRCEVSVINSWSCVLSLGFSAVVIAVDVVASFEDVAGDFSGSSFELLRSAAVVALVI